MARRCAHLHMPKPSLAITLIFDGKDDWWRDDISALKGAIYNNKHYFPCLNEVNYIARKILINHYDNTSDVFFEGKPEPIITQHLLCKILNGKNVRLYTDGSSE